MKTWVFSLLWHFGFSRIQKLPIDIFLNSIPERTSWVCPLLRASALHKAGTEKRITVPALLYVIKIHKYHHVTVWHHRCTAHDRYGDWGNVLPLLIHKSGSLQRRAALHCTPIPNSRGQRHNRTALKYNRPCTLNSAQICFSSFSFLTSDKLNSH